MGDAVENLNDSLSSEEGDDTQHHSGKQCLEFKAPFVIIHCDL